MISYPSRTKQRPPDPTLFNAAKTPLTQPQKPNEPLEKQNGPQFHSYEGPSEPSLADGLYDTKYGERKNL